MDLKKYGTLRKWDYKASDLAARSAESARERILEEYGDKYDPRDMKSYQRFVRHHEAREAKSLRHQRGPLH